MKIELVEREVDQFRNLRGKKKTKFWRQHKRAIIAQGLEQEKRFRDRDEFLNRRK